MSRAGGTVEAEEKGGELVEGNGGDAPLGQAKPRRRGRLLQIVLSLILTGLFVFLLARYVSAHLDEFRELLSRPIPKTHLALLGLAVFLAYLFNAWTLRDAILVHGIRVPFLENLSLTLSTSAANYFLPFKGAVGLRGLYLHRRLGVGVTDFASQLLVVTVITMGVSSIFALGGIFAIGLENTHNEKAAHALTVYYALVPVLGVIMVALGRLEVRLPRRLKAFVVSWDRYRASPWLLTRIIFLDALYYLSWCLVNYLALSAFQVRISPQGVFFYTSLQIHTLILNLTPAGLGVVEAGSVLAGSVLNFSPAEALLAQGLSRLTAIAVLTATGILGWAHLLWLGRRPAAK
jgi:uncharacterized membrane protein YbhN (UPF0104 family)